MNSILLIQSLCLVTALTTDTFLASFAYGAGRIKIPFASALTITAVSTITLCAALFAGSLLRPFLPEQLTSCISFIILLFLGIIKLFDTTIKTFIKKHHLQKNITFSFMHLKFILHVYADPPAADTDASCCLSVREAFTLALAVSIDGLAVGFGSALTDIRIFPILVLSVLLGLIAVKTGSLLGNRLSRALPFDLSWISGLLLIILAFTRF